MKIDHQDRSDDPLARAVGAAERARGAVPWYVRVPVVVAALAAGIYFWAADSGLYRLFCDWRFPSSDPVANGVCSIVVLEIPGLVFLLWLGARRATAR